MKISVIVPVYKAEQYLGRCVDSLLAQTHRHLELILIDDGSPDQSGVICDEYAARDSRVLVIHQENGGPSAARNAGLARADGAYVTFVDSDDYVDSDYCEYLLSLALRHGADIVQCGAYEEGSGGSRVLSPEQDVVLAEGLKSMRGRDWHAYGNANWGKLYRVEVLRGAHFDTRCCIGEDLHFNFQALRKTKTIVLGAAARYHYVLTEGSLFRAAPSRQRLLNCREMLERAREEFADSAELSRLVEDEVYRNDLDICSKIACFHMEAEKDVLKTVRREVRRRLPALVGSDRFTDREKLKFVLIALAWPVYCQLLFRAKAAV
ncbi:MAG: glycosyltransferase [Ruminococcaceae bacterium]|nr:glycosyltransferase [Oscillospiraceae bacterium]